MVFINVPATIGQNDKFFVNPEYMHKSLTWYA